MGFIKVIEHESGDYVTINVEDIVRFWARDTGETALLLRTCRHTPGGTELRVKHSLAKVEAAIASLPSVAVKTVG